MKKIFMILIGLILLTLVDIIEGSGKLALNQGHFFNNADKKILNGLSDYIVDKSDSLEPWVQIPLNLSADLKSVLFIDKNVGFAVGFKTDDLYSLILKTTDGGINWTRYNLTTHVTINSIALIDSNTLITVGGGWNGVTFESVIYKTTDLGDTWIRTNLNEENGFSAVSFNQNDKGVIVGEHGVIYISTDKGLSWTIKRMATWWTDALSDACFLDSMNIFAVGMDGKILKSNDLGNNWESVNSTTTKYLFAIKNVNGNLYITGESGLVLFSNDYGNIWQSQTRVTTAHLFGIHFTSSNDGYIVGGRSDAPGGNNAILKTKDAGVTWQKQTHSSNFIMNDVFFVNDSTGWIVGNSGLILKTTNGGVTFIEDINNLTQPKDFLLEQNYPNPFNPSTRISWQSSVDGWQTLKVYDILGNEVATLVNEYRNAGTYEINFQSAAGGSVGSHQLANGVYFYQLKVEDYIETKKMILLK